MDRSFLSDPAVVAASRAFVCIRLATYESREEAIFMKSLFIGRSGELENTTFTILSPDGKKKLVRAHRSPRQVFRDAADMAASMERISKQVAPKAKIAALPALVDLRRGLNVASCDIQPLVVIGDSKLEKAVCELAWSGDFVGKFAYARSTEYGTGVAVVQPDAYGLKGTVLAKTADRAKLKQTLLAGLEKFAARSKDSRRHIREGRRNGKRWETEIEVTDPGPGRPRR